MALPNKKIMIYLMTFAFTTGSNEYKDQRLVIAKDLDEAYTKGLKWFPETYTESKLLSCVAHPAII